MMPRCVDVQPMGGSHGGVVVIRAAPLGLFIV